MEESACRTNKMDCKRWNVNTSHHPKMNEVKSRNGYDAIQFHFSEDGWIWWMHTYKYKSASAHVGAHLNEYTYNYILLVYGHRLEFPKSIFSEYLSRIYLYKIKCGCECIRCTIFFVCPRARYLSNSSAFEDEFSVFRLAKKTIIQQEKINGARCR